MFSNHPCGPSDIPKTIGAKARYEDSNDRTVDHRKERRYCKGLTGRKKWRNTDGDQANLEKVYLLSPLQKSAHSHLSTFLFLPLSQKFCLSKELLLKRSEKKMFRRDCELLERRESPMK